MTLSQMYKRGYTVGIGSRIKRTGSGEQYILANTDEYVMCAVSLDSGNRWRDPTKFNCAFQLDKESLNTALGCLGGWSA